MHCYNKLKIIFLSTITAINTGLRNGLRKMIQLRKKDSEMAHVIHRYALITRK
jgi:hypothetical protein